MHATLQRAALRDVPVWESAMPDFNSHTAMMDDGAVLEAADYGDGPCWMVFNVCGELIADGEAIDISGAKAFATIWYYQNVNVATDVFAHAR